MVHRKTAIQFISFVLIFICADLFIYNSLSSEFSSFTQERNDREIALFANTAPTNTSDTVAIDAWSKGIQDIIPGSRAMYLGFNPETWTYTKLGGSEAAVTLYKNNLNTTSFEKALESINYLEPIKLSSNYNVDYSLDADATISTTYKSGVYFYPVPDESGAAPLGAVMIVVPQLTTSNYLSLLRNLLLIFALLFISVAFVLMFTRDPMTGFMVMGLFIIVLTFIAFPLFAALRLSFIEDGHFSWDTWKMTLSPTYLVALWGSLRLGVLTATFSTIVGFLFAFLIERTRYTHKKLMGTLATMPVISPPFSLSLSIILLFGNNGLITKQLLHLNLSIYGLGGLTLVETIGMFPIAFMTISGVLRQIDSTMEDASLDLSATRWQTFKNITFPLTVPGILSAWLLVFTNSLADFANPLLLSGDYRVLSTEAYMLVTGRSELGAGAALSFLLLLPTLSAFLAQRYWVSKRSFVTVTGKPSGTLTDLTSTRVRHILEIVCDIIMVFIVGLYLTIVAGCFVKNWGIDYSFTLRNWPEAIGRGWTSIRDTVILAAIAAPIAGILAMLSSMLLVRKKFPFKHVLEMLIMTPYAIPGTLIGIAYILAFNKPPILLVGTGAIIVINYVIRELPVGVENGITALHQIDSAIEEAASDLGADTQTVFRTIVLPLVRPAFLSSMSYTFVRAMTAVSAIIFLISARWNHLTVLIFNFSENLRFGYASVLSTILIVIVLLAFGLMNHFTKGSELTNKQISGQ
jgi:iron(III) transport system permease protein